MQNVDAFFTQLIYFIVTTFQNLAIRQFDFFSHFLHLRKGSSEARVLKILLIFCFGNSLYNLSALK